jgi:protease II
VRDPHRWLEDESTRRSKIWIKAQRAFTTRYLKTIIRRETIESFESKIRRSSEFEEVGAYFQRGSNFFYFGRWASATTISSDAAEGQYRLYMTEDLSKEGRVLLDPSSLKGDGGDQLLVRVTWVSNDGLSVAFGYTRGSDDPWMTICTRLVSGGGVDVVGDKITGVCHVASTCVEWLDRADGFFYSCFSHPPDAAGVLPAEAKHRVCFHRVGQPQSGDFVVYEEGRADPSAGSRPAAGARAGLGGGGSEQTRSPQQQEQGEGARRQTTGEGEEEEGDDADDDSIVNIGEVGCIQEADPEEGAGDDSDKDSCLGSDTWHSNDEQEEDTEDSATGYLDWPGRRESCRPRLSVDGRYLFIEIFLDGIDAGRGVDCMLPDSTRAALANKLYYFDLLTFRGEDERSLGQCVRLVDVFESRWEYLANIEDEVWLRTNYKAPRFRIMRISLPDLEIFESVSRRYLAGVLQSIWMYSLEWIPESADGSLLESALIAAHTVLVLKYLCDASYSVLLFDLTQTLDEASQRHIAELPLVRHCFVQGPWCNFQSPNIFYSCSGFAEPSSIFRTVVIRNAFSGSIELQFEPSFIPCVPCLSPSSFETSQDFCPVQVAGPIASSAPPGARGPASPSTNSTFLRQGLAPASTVRVENLELPMFIFASDDVKERRPCVLFVSGSFGVSMLPCFSPALALFVQHFEAIVCIVNVRGGGELGADWHKSGVGDKKQSAVDDVVTAAEYLVESGYAIKGSFSLMGGTSAGVVVGACIAQRPELFCAAVVVDGVFDLMRHHLLSPPTDGPTLPTRRPLSPAPAQAPTSTQQQQQEGRDGEREKVGEDKDETEDEDSGMELVPLWTQEFGSVDGASFTDAVRLLHLSPLHNVLAPAPVPPRPRGAARRRQGGAPNKPPSPPPVVAKKFPAVLLFVGGASTAPVPRAHSFKFIAELQRVCGSGSTNPLLIHIDREEKEEDEEEDDEGEGERERGRDMRRRGSSADASGAAPVATTDETRRVALALTFLAKFMGAAYCPSDAREDEDTGEDEDEDDAEVEAPGLGPGSGLDWQGGPPWAEERARAREEKQEDEHEGEGEGEGEEEGEEEGEGEGRESLNSQDSLADLGEDFYDGREEGEEE